MIPMDAVPATVTQGRDGDCYVGPLTGFPFPVGGACICRVPAGGGTPAIFRSGFTAAADILFGPHGSLYVLEIAKHGLLAASGGGDWTGGLYKVTPGGVKTEIVVPGGLSRPAAWRWAPTVSSTSRTSASCRAAALSWSSPRSVRQPARSGSTSGTLSSRRRRAISALRSLTVAA